MEAVICKIDRPPTRYVISQTPSIGGTSNQLRWEKECGGNFPNFWNEFCKTLPSQKGISLTFQNLYGHNLPHQVNQISSNLCNIIYRL